MKKLKSLVLLSCISLIFAIAQEAPYVLKRYDLTQLDARPGEVLISPDVLTLLEFDDQVIDVSTARPDAMTIELNGNLIRLRSNWREGNTDLVVTVANRTALFTISIEPEGDYTRRYVIERPESPRVSTSSSTNTATAKALDSLGTDSQLPKWLSVSFNVLAVAGEETVIQYGIRNAGTNDIVSDALRLNIIQENFKTPFKLASFFLLSQCCLLFAQEAAGVLSYLDSEGAGLHIAECSSQEPDPRSCSPNIEVIDLEVFYACEGHLATCEETVAYAIPFVPESAAETVEEDISKAWESFVNKTITEVGSEINQLLPCWIPTPCPPQVNWECVSERMGTALTTANTDHLPKYWTDVYESVAINTPLALHWRSALPNDGAIINPIFSLEPKPDQYAGLAEAPTDYPYYFQGPLFPRLPVPYLPNDLNPEYGGINELEERKQQLEPATLLEYQQFGFVSLFQVYGEYRLELLFDILQGPYLVTACLIAVPPFIIPFPIPLPTPVFVARAFTDWPSVPEGYTIPKIKGQPLY